MCVKHVVICLAKTRDMPRVHSGVYKTLMAFSSLTFENHPKLTCNEQRLDMEHLSYDERVCVQFLNIFKDWADPTWGFRVYGTYSRLQAQGDADGQADGQNAQDLAGELSKFELGSSIAFADNNNRYCPLSGNSGEIVCPR
jgi:hypothetical protein